MAASGETRLNKERILQEIQKCSNNVEKQQEIQGQGIDEPLSETGFGQADAAGRFLRNVRFTQVYSSDLIRAQQTAATIVGESRRCKDIKINFDTRLRERKYGVAEGQPLGDLKTRAKAAGQQCPKYTPPGGETLEEVRARAKDFFEYMCQLAIEESGYRGDAPADMCNGLETSVASAFSLTNCSTSESSSDKDGVDAMLDANILVVSHGAFMRIWIKYFIEDLKCSLPSTFKRSRELSVSPNTGISHFIVNLEGGETMKPEISCICINRDDHLFDLMPDSSC